MRCSKNYIKSILEGKWTFVIISYTLSCAKSNGSIHFVLYVKLAFSRSTKIWYSFFLFSRSFSCNCRTMKMAPVVNFPALNQNWFLLTFVTCFNHSFSTLSKTFMPCSNNLNPCTFHTVVHLLFPCKGVMFLSSGGWWLDRSGACSPPWNTLNNSRTPIAPANLSRSLIIPDGPAALPFLHFRGLYHFLLLLYTTPHRIL